jgi:hypothetical protein
MVIVCDGNDDRIDIEAAEIERIVVGTGGSSLGPALAEAWWINKYEPFASGKAPAPPTIFGTGRRFRSDRAVPLRGGDRENVVEVAEAWELFDY